MQGSVRTRRTGSAEVPPAAPGSASAMLGGGTVLRAPTSTWARPANGAGSGAWSGWPSSSGWPPSRPAPRGALADPGQGG